MSSSTGKTEQPTAQALQTPEKGSGCQSQDLTSALLLIAAVAVVWLIGGYIGGVLQASVKDQIDSPPRVRGEFTSETAASVMWRGLAGMFWV
jgi:flagellar biosynthesis protein FlhB